MSHAHRGEAISEGGAASRRGRVLSDLTVDFGVFLIDATPLGGTKLAGAVLVLAGVAITRAAAHLMKAAPAQE